MVLLYILLAVVIIVFVYLAIVYYFLFCKEKPRREQTGLFAVADPDVYFPKAKKKRLTGKIAAAGLFIPVIRKNNKDKGGNEKYEERKETAFPKNHTSIVLPSVDFEDEENKVEDEKLRAEDKTFEDVKDICCDTESREDKNVKFEDVVVPNVPEDHHSNTYQRSEEVDQGYGTLSTETDQPNSTWYND